MFDGTDLSMAYGSMYETAPASAPTQTNTQMNQSSPDLPLPKATTSHATPPDQVYTPPPAMYFSQTAKPQPVYYSDNFWDKLVSKKWEVIKLIVLSLVVLLGISMDKVVSHYVNIYIGKAFMSETHEFLVRLSYPIMVIIVLWLIKASA